ncbi:hypothetical protein MGAST_07235 [Mycobacterium gastri 'Wayne']|nr:hypothetical protein MGAST_07235 [Mycobacterium gastri 'Wayne']
MPHLWGVAYGFATNLVLLCPYHHRSHHRGLITITGPAANLSVTDHAGRSLHPGSLARPPTVPPYPGLTGERAHWWWYEPFQPHRHRQTTNLRLVSSIVSKLKHVVE